MTKIIQTIILCFICICSVNAQTYKISTKGKELIKKHESCRLKAYKDSNGYSIGWGHHTKDVKPNDVITQHQANLLFCEDIKKVEASVNRLISELPYTYKFSQGFIDGFCSLVYNCGENGVRNTSFFNTLKKCRVKKGVINAQDLLFTINMIKTTKISSNGHKKRRVEEMKMMLH